MGWYGYEGGEPPGDAYSRVTNPERFQPLHAWTLGVVEMLEARYEVSRREEGLEGVEGVADGELERAPRSRPLLRLAPLRDGCVPVTIAFTDFPGLGVRAALRQAQGERTLSLSIISTLMRP